MHTSRLQGVLFPNSLDTAVPEEQSSTFVGNMSLPVHRWFRFSAGFSGAWAEALIRETARHQPARVLDPFAGSGTSLIAAENAGAESWGLEPQPFIVRVARAKLSRRSSPEVFLGLAQGARRDAPRKRPEIDGYPPLIRRCYTDDALAKLDQLHQAVRDRSDERPASWLLWLALVGILRRASHAGTASWQYILPNKTTRAADPYDAFDLLAATMYDDMLLFRDLNSPAAVLAEGDARDCAGVPDGFATLVLTSPPYPNNFDYADATRLEMTFLQEVTSWADLHGAVRRHLIRSCSQHVSGRGPGLHEILASAELDSIREPLSEVCEELEKIRDTRRGRKAYHLMVASYFADLARVWRALRRVCASPSRVCFVIGDSAPYGIYVPVTDWMTRLAEDAGFRVAGFERLRDRNVKWKNRKHRVPLCEGRLWAEG